MEIGESLVFPIELELPGCLHLVGRDWFCTPEFHITTFTPGDLADAFDVDAVALLHAGEQRRDGLTRSRSFRFDGRIACPRPGWAPDAGRLLRRCESGRCLSATVSGGRPDAAGAAHTRHAVRVAAGDEGSASARRRMSSARTVTLSEADAAVLRRYLSLSAS
jgi:hypothetical protein